MAKDIIHRPDGAAMEQLLACHVFDAAGTAVRLAWQAGLERREIAALTWDQVSFLNQEIGLPDRTVPLTDGLCAYLTELSQRQLWNCQTVLVSDHRRRPMQPQPISLAVRRALDEVGQTEVCLRDLRDDYILRLLETTDWQVVSRITSMEAGALNQRFAPYLPEGIVSTRIVADRPPEPDTLRLRQLLQEEGGSEIGRTIRLTWQAGLTIAEIAALTWGRVDLENLEIRGEKETFSIPEELAEYLRPLREKAAGPEEFVVLSPRAHKPMLPDRLSRVTRAALVRAGLDNVTLRDLQRDHTVRAGGEGPILQYAQSHGSITRSEAVDLLGVTKAAAYTRLAQLVDRGRLVRVGARYYPAGTVVPPERQYDAIRDYLETVGVACRQDIAALLHIQDRQCTVVLSHLVEEGKLVREKQRYTLKEV